MKNGHDRLILQPRDLVLLRSLAICRILDRRQIEHLAGFHSVSRVNVRLARLRKVGLIHRYFTATKTGSRRSVYALSNFGAVEVQSPSRPLKWRPDSAVLGNAFVAHQLALNDVYISAVVREIRWQQPLSPLTPAIKLIPDAYIDDGQHSLFIEMDMGTEILGTWTSKVSSYLTFAVSGEYQAVIPHAHFAVLVITDDESRLASLRRHIAKQTSKLFWFATLDIIKGHGFWSAVWLRTTGETLSLPGA